MSLRWIVAGLLLANLVYFTWSRGGLALLGTEPAQFSETEPQRLAQQVRPQMLAIKPIESPKP